MCYVISFYLSDIQQWISYNYCKTLEKKFRHFKAIYQFASYLNFHHEITQQLNTVYNFSVRWTENILKRL